MPSRRQVLHTGLAASAAIAVSPSPLLAALRRIEVPRSQGRPWLDVARKAERWLALSMQPTAHGVTWPMDPAKPEARGTDLYHGAAGVVLFHLELHHATGDTAALETAVRGARHLAATLPDESDARASTGLYTGLAGVAYTLAMVASVSGDSPLSAEAQRALLLVHRRARGTGAGVEWDPSTDIISGAAGIGLLLLWAVHRMRDPSALDLAAKAGRRLIERGQPAATGTKWLIQPEMPRNYPNFSHGTAGVAYFLASLYGETKERAFLDAARAGAAYLDSIATPTPSGGRMVYHSEPGNEQIFYLSWCHGPVGTARLYHRLAQVTGERAYRERVGQLTQAIADMKVPERSPGFWNNISQCCGNSGVVEYLLDQYRQSGDARHLQYAERISTDTLQRGSGDDAAMKWVQAEHRVRPELLIAHTGLMQGAAGVGLAMLHLDGAVRGRMPSVVLPDNPFTAS